MPSLPLTTVTASIFAAMLVVPGFRVSLRRVKLGGLSLGDGGDAVLQRRVRAHGNFMDYAPMALTCTALPEFQAAPRSLVVALASCFVATRLPHALGMLYSRSPAAWAVATMIQRATFLAAAAYPAYHA